MSSSATELMIDGKPISALRVVDLKEELEKLGLSKSGSKKDLYERLKAHLLAVKRREVAAGDAELGEQLPNISMQEKLAEQNPLLRDYFASQAELFHSQQLVKKQYQEEKKRESEASADESADSPVKSRAESPVKIGSASPVKIMLPEASVLTNVGLEQNSKSPQKTEESVKPQPAKRNTSVRSSEMVGEEEVLDFGEDVKEPSEVDTTQIVVSQETNLNNKGISNREKLEETKSESEASADESADTPTKSREDSPSKSASASPDERIVSEESVQTRLEPEPASNLSSTDQKSVTPQPAKRNMSVRSTEIVGEEEVLDFGEDVKEPGEADATRISGIRKINVKNKGVSKRQKQGWSWKKSGEQPWFPSWRYIKQNFYPNLRPIPDDELKFDVDDATTATEDERTGSRRKEYRLQDFQITRTISNEFAENNGKADEEEQNEEELRSKVEASLRKNSRAEQVEEEREVTPSRNPPSELVIVTNLVRPFTINQLQELLQRTGTVAELWIDRIKSKCIAKFEKVDEALETRAALHGIKWPASNTKALRVDFTTEERMNEVKARDVLDDKPKVEEKSSTALSMREREWDLGKRGIPREGENGRRRSRSKSPEKKRVRRPSRSPRRNDERRESHSHNKDHRDRDHVNEKDKKDSGSTGKALDELFRKTVATPCIYWLPLTQEQIAEKEDLRRKRMVERDRRIAEMSQQHRFR